MRRAQPYASVSSRCLKSSVKQDWVVELRFAGDYVTNAEIVPADDAAITGLLKDLWTTGDVGKVAEGVLGAGFIWGEDLNAIPGLTAMVTEKLALIQTGGMRKAVESIFE